MSDAVLDDGKDHKSGFMSPLLHRRQKTGVDGYQANAPGKCNQRDLALSTTYGDSGSFSRFFSLDRWWEERISRLPEAVRQAFTFLIVPKAAPSEKHGSLPNTHLTVKPIQLMSYLITLGSPEGELVLDPFVGSGTTAISCRLLNRRSLGFEIEQTSVEIARRRLAEVKEPLIQLEKAA